MSRSRAGKTRRRQVLPGQASDLYDEDDAESRHAQSHEPEAAHRLSRYGLVCRARRAERTSQTRSRRCGPNTRARVPRRVLVSRLPPNGEVQLRQVGTATAQRGETASWRPPGADAQFTRKMSPAEAYFAAASFAATRTASIRLDRRRRPGRRCRRRCRGRRWCARSAGPRVMLTARRPPSSFRAMWP